MLSSLFVHLNYNYIILIIGDVNHTGYKQVNNNNKQYNTDDTNK